MASVRPGDLLRHCFPVCVSLGCQEGVGDSMICHAVGSIWEEHHYDGCFKKQCYVDPNKDNKYTTTTVGAGKAGTTPNPK